MMDSFFEDRFKAKRDRGYYTVDRAAIDLGIRNSSQPWHDCMNIKAKPFSPLTDSRFRAPRL